jgi:hypothetical protein
MEETQKSQDKELKDFDEESMPHISKSLWDIEEKEKEEEENHLHFTSSTPDPAPPKFSV